MEKWVLWVLLEAATVMAIASLWILWRAKKLSKPSNDKQTDSVESDESVSIEENTTLPLNNSAEDDEQSPFKAFAKALELQANEAADVLKSLRTSDDLETVTRFKLWGTLVKAERAILLNDETEKPQAILNRFMASIISTLESVKNRNLTKHSLTETLKETDAEFIQASELLISKEELVTNQRELHGELHKSIEFAEKKLNKLKVKDTELQRLRNELKKQKDQVSKLEEHAHHNQDLKQTAQAPEKDTPQIQHSSTRHLHQLERLSKRQQAIIEHLQAQLKDSANDKGDQKEKAQQMAISRMERLANESSSLIEQLQSELESTNLSISSLKQEIHDKDKQLEAIDEQLKSSEGGVLGEYQTLSSNKRDTLESILGGFANLNKDTPERAQSISEQEKEVLNLEQMLKESETCVQLLAQELESAETENVALRERIERQTKDKRNSTNAEDMPKELLELEALREEHRDLVGQIQHMKDSLLNQVSGSTEKTLRNEYNKKSLELDRLQLAYSDLERKYLGTLR